MTKGQPEFDATKHRIAFGMSTILETGRGELTDGWPTHGLRQADAALKN